jgi:hypothetical protein
MNAAFGRESLNNPATFTTAAAISEVELTNTPDGASYQYPNSTASFCPPWMALESTSDRQTHLANFVCVGLVSFAFHHCLCSRGGLYMDSSSFANNPFLGVRYDCSRISGL